MDKLPNDVLARIGDFLPFQTHAACTEASKTLKGIHGNCKYHKFTLTGTNVSGLARLAETARYITDLKPRLTELEIVFDKITDPSLIVAVGACPPNASFTTYLHFTRCATCVIDKVLAVFTWPSTQIMVSIDGGLTGNEAFLGAAEPRPIASIGMVLSKRNLGVLKNRRFCTSKKIILVTHFTFDDGNVVVDLSHIDARVNQGLTISNSNEKLSTMTYIDAWKITKFIDAGLQFNRGRIDNEGLASSLSQYANHPEKIRMAIVTFSGDLSAQGIYMLIGIAKTLPKHVEWNVCVRSPGDLAYIDQLQNVGLSKIKYMCVDKETYLAALLSRKLLGREFNFNLNTTCMYNDADQNGALTGANDVYNAMCGFTKLKWFAVWKAATQGRETKSI